MFHGTPILQHLMVKTDFRQQWAKDRRQPNSVSVMEPKLKEREKPFTTMLGRSAGHLARWTKLHHLRHHKWRAVTFGKHSGSASADA